MKNILLIQTGGTIVMDLNRQQQDSDETTWSGQLSKEIPELRKIANITTKDLFREDSSDINHTHWDELAGYLFQQYDHYDGFVVLHGTDTMAYTATALSFALRNLGKPVICTGSQVPMERLRSDARRNLVNSIEMATLDFREVAICFNDHLFRGNRTTKMSIGDFDAFSSPNHIELAEIGIEIEVHVQPPQTDQEPELYTGFRDEVALLTLYPNQRSSFFKALDLSSLRAVVIEAFGSGNFPMKGPYSLRPFLERCVEQDVIVLITSQAAYDSVDLTIYNSGRFARQLGAISARDMTVECCLVKLMHLLGQSEDQDEVRKALQQNMVGEITL